MIPIEVNNLWYSRTFVPFNCHYSKTLRIRNSVFANQDVQFLVHDTVFQIEAGWFLKCHKRNSLILKVFTVKNHSVMLFH